MPATDWLSLTVVKSYAILDLVLHGLILPVSPERKVGSASGRFDLSDHFFVSWLIANYHSAINLEIR